MEIAFVGLGQMGRHMAANLLKSGARITVTSASGKRHDNGNHHKAGQAASLISFSPWSHAGPVRFRRIPARSPNQ